MLVIAVVLLVAAESKRDRKPGKKVGLGKGKGGNKRPNKNGKSFDKAYNWKYKQLAPKAGIARLYNYIITLMTRGFYSVADIILRQYFETS